jgi:hypothetical protein
MSSNVAFAMRAILAKKSMNSPVAQKLSTANLFGVVNMIACALTLPIALALEAPRASASWKAALAKGVSAAELTKLIVATGITYYLYNEFAFLCLGKVDPVTHAVANTVKRVAVIAVSIVYFQNPITKEGILGSAVAVVGVLLYSLALNAERPAAAGALAALKGSGKAKGKCSMAKCPKGKAACPKGKAACPKGKAACPKGGKGPAQCPSKWMGGLCRLFRRKACPAKCAGAAARKGK